MRKTTPFEHKYIVSMGGCWEWLSARDRDGYGVTSYYSRGKTINLRAHRVSFEKKYGYIPLPPLQINHTCDNRACVNPDHLYAGTSKQNARDRDTRGRGASGNRHWTRANPRNLKRGEDHGANKLLESQVLDIRKRSLEKTSKRVELAEEYNVSYSLINQICRGLAWSHLKTYVAEVQFSPIDWMESHDELIRRMSLMRDRRGLIKSTKIQKALEETFGLIVSRAAIYRRIQKLGIQNHVCL